MTTAIQQQSKLVSRPLKRKGLVPRTVAMLLGWTVLAATFIVATLALPHTAVSGVLLLLIACAIVIQLLFLTILFFITRVASAGADVATMPYKMFHELVQGPLTAKHAYRFLPDWKGHRKLTRISNK
jgi:hypothetical protein